MEIKAAVHASMEIWGALFCLAAFVGLCLSGEFKEKQDKIFAICNCNVNVCYALRTSQLFNTPNMSRSAYVAHVNKQNCVACGRCVEYCPAGALSLGQKLCRKDGSEVTYPKMPLPSEQKWGRHMWTEVEKGEPFTLGEFRITPFGVPHDSTDNVGYQVEWGDITFCLITDVGHVTEDMCEYIGRANYLVMEANHDVEMLQQGPYPQYLKDRIMGDRGHLCNADCGKALAENATEKLKHVWLCHISEENNHPELARKTVEQILRGHGIVAGKDFALEVLRRKVPSEIYTLV